VNLDPRKSSNPFRSKIELELELVLALGSLLPCLQMAILIAKGLKAHGLGDNEVAAKKRTEI
jgi:hypothetical protein